MVIAYILSIVRLEVSGESGLAEPDGGVDERNLPYRQCIGAADA
jgi:hypothetical protein